MKISLIVIIAIVFLIVFFLTSYPKRIPRDIDLDNVPQVIAHKGMVSNDFFGNSLEAIQQALASPVRAVEIDVRISKDNIPIVFHDSYLEIQTTGSGVAEDYTWYELQKLTYKGTNSKILSLEQTLNLLVGIKYIFLDVKSEKIFGDHLVEQLVNLIHKYKASNSIIVESFNPVFLQKMGKLGITTMYDFAINTHAIGEELQSEFDRIPWILRQPFLIKQIVRIIKPDFLAPRFNVNPKILKSWIQSGYPLVTWTVDEVDTAKQLLEIGVVAMQSNRPIELMSQL